MMTPNSMDSVEVEQINQLNQHDSSLMNFIYIYTYVYSHILSIPFRSFRLPMLTQYDCCCLIFLLYFVHSFVRSFTSFASFESFDCRWCYCCCRFPFIRYTFVKLRRRRRQQRQRRRHRHHRLVLCTVIHDTKLSISIEQQTNHIFWALYEMNVIQNDRTRVFQCDMHCFLPMQYLHII